MYLKMTIAIIATVISSIECKQSYIIKGSGWNNELEKCASGGDEFRTYNFNIGTMGSIPELKYDDLNIDTAVIAHGYYELHTSTGSEVKQRFDAMDYNYGDQYKSFSKTWRRSTTSGLASQTVTITLTLKFHKDGLIELVSNVYASSWLAFTCASSKAFVQTIEIIN